jgi:alpha-N-acetylglucosamine transferase
MQTRGETSQAKCAYVTLVTSDTFCQGADVMLYSLQQTKCTADIVVLVTPQVSKQERHRLAKRGVTVMEVTPIENPNQSVHVEGWINSGYTKLHIWNLDYESVVYLDADVLVLENIDEVLFVLKGYCLLLTWFVSSFLNAPCSLPQVTFYHLNLEAEYHLNLHLPLNVMCFLSSRCISARQVQCR